MLNRGISFICLLGTFLSASSYAQEDINQIYSPVLLGETLLIKGDIDTHIYDYLSREWRNLQSVKTIELNSNGGDINAAMDLVPKIRSLHVTTKISTGSVCASACVLLFAAGEERIADRDFSFGIHGVRLEVSEAEHVYRACGRQRGFAPNNPECRALLQRWVPKIQQSTDLYFKTLEALGVSPELKELYYALADDPQWFQKKNLFRKPDYNLSSQEALGVNLVNHILPVVTASVQ